MIIASNAIKSMLLKKNSLNRKNEFGYYQSITSEYERCVDVPSEASSDSFHPDQLEESQVSQY